MNKDALIKELETLKQLFGEATQKEAAKGRLLKWREGDRSLLFSLRASGTDDVISLVQDGREHDAYHNFKMNTEGVSSRYWEFLHKKRPDLAALKNIYKVPAEALPPHLQDDQKIIKQIIRVERVFASKPAEAEIHTLADYRAA